MENKKKELEFRGGKGMSLIPLIISIIFAIYFFGFAGVYDVIALALGGFVALIIGSFFAKNIQSYWDAVVKGMSDELGNTLALILIVVGIFGKMMSYGQITEGFIWLGDMIHVSGSTLCVFTFIITAIIATSTGSSVSTILTMIPILLPVAAVMNANIPVFVGAVISGALFGDSIGLVSDVTIASSQTQEYSHISGRPDIGGVVKARIKYSMTAFVISAVLFMVFGSNGASGAMQEDLMAQYSNPKGLFMLIPMVLLLACAFKTKNIYLSATIGSISGAIVGLLTGIMTPSDILSVQDGAVSGFIIEGINGMVGTILFVYSLVGMIGILKECGMMDAMVDKLLNSKAAQSVIGTELIIAFGAALTGLLIGSANGPACLMFGTIANEIGKRANLHPYRRANLLAAFTSSLPIMNPFSSLFIILAMGSINSVCAEYPFIEAISPLSIPPYMFFCMIFPLVFLVSIFTGWGREYEGENGEVVKKSKKAA